MSKKLYNCEKKKLIQHFEIDTAVAIKMKCVNKLTIQPF